MKVHLAKTHPGSKPAWGARNSATCGMSLSRTDLMATDRAWQCVKCSAIAARQTELLAKRQAG